MDVFHSQVPRVLMKILQLRLRLLLLLTPCLLGVVGCSGKQSPMENNAAVQVSPSSAAASPTVSTQTQVEQAIAAYLPKEVGVPLQSVACPPTVKLEVGKVFACNVKIAEGTFPVNVTVKDASGLLTLKTRQILLLPEAEKELQESIKKRDRIDVKANCGNRKVKIPQKIGETFQCKLTGKDGKKGTATLTVTSKEGKVDAKWQI